VPNAPILPQCQHSSSVGLSDDLPNEESSCPRPRLCPRPLPAPPLEWFSTSRFFLHASHSSLVRYSFPSYCNDIDTSSNASSASFNHPIRFAIDIVDTSSNVLIVIYLKRGGRDRSIFATISPSFTSSPSVVSYTAMPLRHNS
jgi:hypothetical protein